MKIAYDIFKYILFDENVWTSITISLKFVPKGPIDNKSALVHVMAWRWTGKKLIYWPSSPTHIYDTRGKLNNQIRNFFLLHILFSLL